MRRRRWIVRVLYVVLFQVWWLAILVFQGAALAFPMDASVLAIYLALCVPGFPLLTVLAYVGRHDL